MAILKTGSKGAQVVNLQKKLKDLGLYSGATDGKFGPATKAAVIAFQKSKKLKGDGIAGPRTMAALEAATKGPATETGKPATSDTGATKTTTATPGTPKLLTEADFQAAAAQLNCDVAAIKAVAEVESSGAGFLSDGRVKILFEGHQFYKFTKGAHARSNPSICYRKWTKQFYTKGRNADIRGAGELARLDQAIALNREAALKSASYGKFQIMGFNHMTCGFSNVQDFYAAMQSSEGEQLKAFCGFIRGAGLADKLRKHRWAEFARGYNGAEYWKNQYDKKLAAAHAKYSRQ